MDKISIFSQVFLMMPSKEAAACLLALSLGEQLALLREAKHNRLSYIPAKIAETKLCSLQVFDQVEEKIGEVLMAMAALAGEKVVYELINKWSMLDPLISQDLRQQIFFFEEVIYIEDRSLQLLFREQKLQALMLIDSSDAAKEKLLRNVSKRIGKEVCEDLARLEGKMATDESAYRIKGEFCQLVIKMRSSGELAPIEFPVSEITIRAFVRDVNWIAENMLALDRERLVYFIKEYADEKLIKILLESKYGAEIKAAMLPLLSQGLRQQLERLLAETPKQLNSELVFWAGTCRKNLETFLTDERNR